MKKNKIWGVATVLMFMGGFYSCQPEEINILATKKYAEKSGTLRAEADFPIGFGIDYTSFMTNETYKNIVIDEADNVTFGYSMKHGALVDNAGNINFMQADALYNAAEGAGLEVFGHTLGWHSNQNATYLNSLVGDVGPQQPNLLTNPGFEEGLTGWAPQNTGNPAGSSSFTHTTAAGEPRTGNGALKVVVDQSYGTSQWRVQMHTPAFVAESGKTYNVSFWIKAASAGGSARLSASPTGMVANAYQGDQDNIGTDWTQVNWTITMTGNEAAQKISFDMGKAANTYFIDDVKITDAAPVVTNLIDNSGFENLLTGWASQNTGNPSGSSSFTHTTAAGEPRTGTGALKVVVDQSYGTSQWRVQMHSPAFAATSGKTYNISFWIKAATTGGSVRLSASPTASVTNAYQGDQDNIGTDWTQITWAITMSADEAAQKISFDIGKAANTYFIDDVKIEDAALSGGGGDGEDTAERVENALNDFITTTVNHYQGKVKAWDVVNEALVDNGSIRTSDNTVVPSEATDHFFWADHLGRDWVLKAFQFAEAADPEALLFINDYNLEYSPAKVDGLIALVAEMKEKGAKIDGIGTQMHIGINSSYSNIDYMFKRLAETGLLIRISELDVRANPLNKTSFVETDEQALSYQAVMYEYAIKSYLKHIPAAQRHGVTIWGVGDGDSWITTVLDRIDAPLLYNRNYEKKPAFFGVFEALKAQ